MYQLNIKRTLNWIVFLSLTTFLVIVLSAKNRLLTLESSIRSQLNHLHHVQLNQMTIIKDIDQQHSNTLDTPLMDQLKQSRLMVLSESDLRKQLVATKAFDSFRVQLLTLIEQQPFFTLYRSDFLKSNADIQRERQHMLEHIDLFNDYVSYVKSHVLLKHILTSTEYVHVYETYN